MQRSDAAVFKQCECGAVITLSVTPMDAQPSFPSMPVKPLPPLRQHPADASSLGLRPSRGIESSFRFGVPEPVGAFARRYRRRLPKLRRQAQSPADAHCACARGGLGRASCLLCMVWNLASSSDQSNSAPVASPLLLSIAVASVVGLASLLRIATPYRPSSSGRRAVKLSAQIGV